MFPMSTPALLVMKKKNKNKNKKFDLKSRVMKFATPLKYTLNQDNKIVNLYAVAKTRQCKICR